MDRGLAVGRGLAALLIVLAGCSAGAPMPEPAQEEPPASSWSLAADGCHTTAVFFLVEYHQADAFLPPAFQPRDLAAFLYYTPATSGKVPAFVALSTCESLDLDGPAQHEGTLQITYLGFFVEPPVSASAYAAPGADFDFYSVAYLGPTQGPASVAFNVTQDYGWRNEPAEVRLSVALEGGHDVPGALQGVPVPQRIDAIVSRGAVVQGGQETFSFDARGFFPQTFAEPPTLRFWHDGPRGLGFLEFDLPMKSVPAGPVGACDIAPGSIVHEVIGHEGSDGACGPSDTFALVFARHDLVGRLHHFEGLHGVGSNAPPAAPLPPEDGASLRVRARLDVQQAVTHDIPQASATPDVGGASFCHDGAGNSAPSGGWQRYDDPFIVDDGATPFIRFRDDYQENGCGEALFAVDVPAGATSMGLSFQVDRQVESQTRLATPRAFQTLQLYAGDVHRPEPLGCFARQDVFPPSWPSTRRVQEFSTTFDFTRCAAGTLDDMVQRGIVIGFGFQDGGAAASGGQVPDGVPAGQLFRGSVYAPQVTFDGVGLRLDASSSAGLDPSGTVVGFVTRAVDVPAPLPGQGHEVTFSLSNQHGILGMYKRSGDSLQRLGDEKIEAREVEGRLVFTIGADVVEAHGPGRYEVVFTAPDTGRVSMLRLPLVAVALLVPLVAGAVAQRNLNHVHRLARGPRPRRRHALQGALVVAWAAYAAVALALFITDIGIGMAAWPVPPRNLAAYLALATVAAAMVTIAVAARRLELWVIQRDLSELAVAQRELQRSNRELEQFAYVASHDLKEPLRVVAGYTQLLGMRYGDRLDEKGRTFLGFAADGASRLQRMVDDLLAYSRVRAGPEGPQPVSLADAMVAVQLHLEGLIEQRRVRLRVGGLPVVMAERGQVVQLLLNLVQNAIKFSPQEAPEVEVQAVSQDGQVTVHVRDQGIGIDAGQQERIFQIFQRLHLREEYEGNGIGLAVCRKIVEQFGGKIWVDSAPGQGSTFSFTLPAAPSPVRRSRPSPAAHPT